MVEKNHSYLAIQLQKFCHAYGRRQLEIAFLHLAEHALRATSAGVEVEEVEPRTAAAAQEPVEAAPVSHAVARASVVETSRSRRARAVEENLHLGFQTLSSICALQLRYALRRWENFSRRKHFEERQSKVVHALRNVQAELDGKRLGSVASELSPMAPGLSPSAEMSVGSFDELLAAGGDGLRSYGYDSPSRKSHHQSDEDLVKSLCEDQARIDEVIKLAAIIWDNASLANMQPAALPLVLLKASLLARMAERCQRHVMKEALHLLWKRCTLQRSMEELLSQGHLLKRGDVSHATGSAPSRHSDAPLVTQGPAASIEKTHPEPQPAVEEVVHPELLHSPNISAAHVAPEAAEPAMPQPVERRASLASEASEATASEEPRRASGVGWDAVADAVARPAETVVTQPVVAPRPGPTVISMAGLESEEPSEAESDIDDDALVAILG